jgi:hypothetical protein
MKEPQVTSFCRMCEARQREIDQLRADLVHKTLMHDDAVRQIGEASALAEQYKKELEEVSLENSGLQGELMGTKVALGHISEDRETLLAIVLDVGTRPEHGTTVAVLSDLGSDGLVHTHYETETSIVLSPRPWYAVAWLRMRAAWRGMMGRNW